MFSWVSAALVLRLSLAPSRVSPSSLDLCPVLPASEALGSLRGQEDSSGSAIAACHSPAPESSGWDGPHSLAGSEQEQTVMGDWNSIVICLMPSTHYSIDHAPHHLHHHHVHRDRCYNHHHVLNDDQLL